MVGPIGSVGGMSPSFGQVAGIPSIKAGVPPPGVPQVDTVSLSPKAQRMLNTEELLKLIILMLLMADKKGKGEESMATELGITVMALQQLTQLSPYIKLEAGNYSLVGSVATIGQAVESGLVGNLFNGGVAAAASLGV
jgi:hypothetical protein